MRLSNAGGPFDVSGRRFQVVGGRIYLGGVDVTDAKVMEATYSSYEGYHPVMTVELVFPDGMRVRSDIQEWHDQLEDQEELL